MEQKDTPKLGRADLLSLPEEVFYRHIFSQLSYPDMLRLRRVCSPIKHFANSYMRTNISSHVREINETTHPLQHYLQVNLTSSSIFINNSSPSFFEDPSIPQFLNLHGSQITHLKINHFGALISEQELHFFSSLPNLLHLEILFTDATQRDCYSTYKDHNNLEVRLLKSQFPPNFKNLKTLKLHEIQGSRQDDLFYAWDFLDFCENLEYANHALYKVPGPFDRDHPMGQFGCIFNYIKRRQETNPDQPNLQFYDLEYYNHGNDIHGNRMPWLIALCEFRGVKLLNVNSNLLNTEVMLGTSPLVSLRNVQGPTFMAELPNLEKLVVESTERSGFEESWEGENVAVAAGLMDDDNNLGAMPEWPNLKILEVKIDSRMMPGDRRTLMAGTEQFFEFLFEGKNRGKVEELAVRFDLNKVFFKCIGHVPVPSVRDVVGACPNVTRLTLEGWMGTNKQVSLFWKGLPRLEEVVLGECVKLGDVAFVGKEREDPVFLKLTHLRKVTLRRMDLMHKITDLAFNLVFCRLKVKEFCLTSAKPIKWITAAGIESLVDGNFNKSVENFCFDGWSLDGVSEEAFMQLKMKFRASHMI